MGNKCDINCYKTLFYLWSCELGDQVDRSLQNTKRDILEEVMQNNKLYVGNLNYSVESSELKDLFLSYGEVKSIKILDGKGFGFVEMASQTEADNAKKELNGKEFKGRALKIDIARPQTTKNGSRNFDRGNRSGGQRNYQRSNHHNRNDEY